MLAGAMLDQRFGLSEQEIKNRAKIVDHHIKAIEKPLQEVIQEIKESGDWKVVPFNEIRRRYNLPASERPIFLYGLQSDKNIVTRPAQLDPSSKTEKVSSTTPLEYKFVNVEEKDRAGIDSVYVRRINGERKEELKSFLEQHELKNKPTDILTILDYICTKGADKGWIKLETLKMVGDIGMPVEIVLSVLNEMTHLHMIAVSGRTFGNSSRIRPICVITKTQEEIEKRAEEAKHPESIELYEPPKQVRTKRKRVISLKDESYMILSANENLVKEDSVKTEKEDPKNIPDILQRASTEILNILKEQAAISQEKISRQKDLMDRLAKECEMYRAKSDAQSASIQKMKSKIEALNRFNDAYVANAQSALTIMSGRFMSLMEQFTGLHHYELKNPDIINRYKGKVMEIIGDTSKRITDFQMDRLPPNLKN